MAQGDVRKVAGDDIDKALKTSYAKRAYVI